MEKCETCGEIILSHEEAIARAKEMGSAIAFGHWHDDSPSYGTLYRVRDGRLQSWYDAPWQVGGSSSWQDETP